MNQKFCYLDPYEREEIECLHNHRATTEVIADRIGAHTATIYHELQKGYEWEAGSELIIDAYGRWVYCAEIT